MPKKQTKPSKPVPPFNGHIVYPYSPQIKEIFLRETNCCLYGVYKNGKKIAHQQISQKFRSALQTMGFEIKKEPVIHTKARKRVFGVGIDVSKVMDGTKIKELFIRIPAYTLEELSEKRQIITSKVSAITKVASKSSDVTNKINRC